MRTALKNFFTRSRLLTAVLGLGLILLPLSATAAAQEQGEPQTTPQQNPARALNLMQRLNLSREQRQQLREIRRLSEPEMRAHTRRMRLARRALDEAIYADSIDDALIEQRAREFSAAQAALTGLRAATELKIRRVLTDEQLRLFRTLRQEEQRRQMLQRRQKRNAPPPATTP